MNVLFSLGNLAFGQGYMELSLLFRPATRAVKGFVKPITDEEKSLVRMMLCLVRDQVLCPTRTT